MSAPAVAGAASAAIPGTEPTSRAARASLGTVLGTIEERLRRHWHRPALAIRRDGAWSEFTFDDVALRSMGRASMLLAWGAQRGDRVVLLGRSSPDWVFWFFASVMSGATIVPLDPQLTDPELERILRDADPQYVFADDAHLMRVRAILEAIGGDRRAASLTTGPGDTHMLDPQPAARPPGAWPRARAADEIALLVYTSGTTGEPKGVMIPFRALLFEVRRLEEAMRLRPGECFLSVLPLHHTLELTGGLLSVLAVGGSVCYASSMLPDDLLRDLRERRVSGIIAVPLLLRALQRGIEQRVHALPPLDRARYRAAWALAGALPSRRARRFLFAPLHSRLGGRLRTLVCGGAPLGPEIERWFDRLGIVVLQGYGLTETGPVISVNTHRHRRIGSVGRPLAGAEVKIRADEATANGDGEILTRGPHVMRGYFRRTEETHATIDADGWLHTGDRGHLDRDGYLYVTGRAKSLIVLAAGKKVQPEEVEAALVRGDAFAEVCVIGRRSRQGMRTGSEEVCAIVVPSAALRERLRSDANAPREEVARAVLALAPYKRPTQVLVHEGELPKTANRKLRRAEITAWAESIEIP